MPADPAGNGPNGSVTRGRRRVDILTHGMNLLPDRKLLIKGQTQYGPHEIGRIFDLGLRYEHGKLLQCGGLLRRLERCCRNLYPTGRSGARNAKLFHFVEQCGALES